MNLLLYCEIAENLAVPDFGRELQQHLAQKRHPEVRAASLTAWNLLALGLKRMDTDHLPHAVFENRGKPVFTNCGLHFSIAHSHRLAAVLISDAACAVDIEAMNPETKRRLYRRCLSEAEILAGCGFFEAWTRKECIGKLSGRGIPAHPAEVNSLDGQYDGCFFSHSVSDSQGQSYTLTALCTDRQAPAIQKIKPETLF